MTRTGSELSFRNPTEGSLYVAIDGHEYQVGTVRAAFPLSNRKQMLVIRDIDGNEVAILDRLGSLERSDRHLMRTWLDKSYFVPWIKNVIAIREAMGVAHWVVDTDRGHREFEVRNPRRNIRHVYARHYVVTDVDGNRYRLPPIENLPARAQVILGEYV